MNYSSYGAQKACRAAKFDYEARLKQVLPTQKALEIHEQAKKESLLFGAAIQKGIPDEELNVL